MCSPQTIVCFHHEESLQTPIVDPIVGRWLGQKLFIFLNKQNFCLKDLIIEQGQCFQVRIKQDLLSECKLEVTLNPYTAHPDPESYSECANFGSEEPPNSGGFWSVFWELYHLLGSPIYLLGSRFPKAQNLIHVEASRLTIRPRSLSQFRILFDWWNS